MILSLINDLPYLLSNLKLNLLNPLSIKLSLLRHINWIFKIDKIYEHAVIFTDLFLYSGGQKSLIVFQMQKI